MTTKASAVAKLTRKLLRLWEREALVGMRVKIYVRSTCLTSDWRTVVDCCNDTDGAFDVDAPINGKSYWTIYDIAELEDSEK